MRIPIRNRAGCALVLAGLATAALPGAGEPGHGPAATHSSKAAQSLLLDATRAGDRVLAVGEWGHVVISDDAGASWRQARTVPTQATLTGVSFADAQHGWAVGTDAVVIHSSDGGETWQLQHAAPELEASLLSVWFGATDRGVAVGAFGLLLETDDGGRSWQRGGPGQSDDDTHLNDVFEASDGTLFAAAEAGRVYRRRDGGAWERIDLPYDGSFWGGLALRSGAVLVFGMRGHIFRSNDLGESWRELASGTDQSLSGGAELGDGTIVIGGLGGTLVESRDGGLSFRAKTTPERRSVAAVAPGPDGGVLLFGEAGVEISEPE